MCELVISPNPILEISLIHTASYNLWFNSDTLITTYNLFQDSSEPGATENSVCTCQFWSFSKVNNFLIHVKAICTVSSRSVIGIRKEIDLRPKWQVLPNEQTA